jgi:Na+-translocating ferredoxin:NAD+ oxidoreductase RNF subunit RnfB
MLHIFLPLIILGVLGILFGCLLGFASKKFAVEKDPLLIEVRSALPGANCGACGFAGCVC